MKIQTLQVGPIGTNCYLVCDPEARLCAVIDPGGSAPRIADAIAQSGCTPRCILLTHGHFDHVGGVAGLRERFPGLPVYLNRRDVYPGAQGEMAHLFPPVPDTTEYDEGDTVTVGALTFAVLATPGHTEGGVTLRCGGALFCGDTLFAGSCGRTDFPGGSTKKMLASLRRLANPCRRTARSTRATWTPRTWPARWP
jgi:hydroxyacylglutathione hydrolase